MGRTRVRVGAATDVGRTRSHNEDNYGLRVPDEGEVADRKGILFVVCDGMGGHAAGEVASQIAVETVLDRYYQSRADDPAESLVEAIQLANRAIFEQAALRPEQRGMGTTCVAVVIRGEEVTVAHVGDSRAYLLRGGSLARLTRDHSLVEEWVAKGMLPAAEADHHPMANVITRALGHAPEVQVELRREPATAGDVLMLCSDGLSGKVSEDLIRSTLLEFDDPDQAVSALIALANDAGGPDNISVIVARVDEVVARADLQNERAGEEPTDPRTQRLGQTERLSRPAAAGAPTAPAVRLPDGAPPPPRGATTAAGSTLPRPLLRGCYVAAAVALLALMLIALVVGAALLGWVPGLRLVDAAPFWPLNAAFR
jgi:protein phosphatase